MVTEVIFLKKVWKFVCLSTVGKAARESGDGSEAVSRVDGSGTITEKILFRLGVKTSKGDAIKICGRGDRDEKKGAEMEKSESLDVSPSFLSLLVAPPRFRIFSSAKGKEKTFCFLPGDLSRSAFQNCVVALLFSFFTDFRFPVS